ncbi:MAG TPA: hypothetical protein IAD03_06805 [Candidatus Caccousia stercoris]|uniref:Uncharacterized protein n=1 Tax=Candidatus Caccousia stercoris TaxID=2840723 RepID=A0A9D1FSB0_9FIRM|nr:hypothetical protein [Candidatus Caccousia stercoris]
MLLPPPLFLFLGFFFSSLFRFFVKQNAIKKEKDSRSRQIKQNKMLGQEADDVSGHDGHQDAQHNAKKLYPALSPFFQFHIPSETQSELSVPISVCGIEPVFLLL